MTNDLYSVRMHASCGGKHVSGAERIVSVHKIRATTQELLARATGRSVVPDQIVLNIKAIDELIIRELTALDLTSVDAHDMNTCRTAASHILRTTGVSARAAEAAILLISRGAASSGGTMRGAMIMDAATGDRLEPDQERGVRASRVDWTDTAGDAINRRLHARGLTHYRTREALALATKIAHAPAMVAELCWSDEPEYTAGYVASLKTGYVRFPYLKQQGDPCGGRAFFVDRNKLDLNDLIRYLQTVPVLITAPGECRSHDQVSSRSLFHPGKGSVNV